MTTSNPLRLSALTTSDQDRIEPDVMAEIAMIKPDDSLFLTLMEKAKRVRTATQMSFKKPRQFPFERVLHAAAANSSATTLTILNYLYLVGGSILRNNRTNEILKVDTTPSSSSVTVTRAWGTTAGAAILATDDLLLIHNTIAEGGAIPDAVQRNTEHLTYYVNHDGRSIDITDIMDASKQWGIREKTRLLDQQLSEWNKDRNFKLMYGQPKYDTTGNLVTAETAGLDYYTSKYNTFDCGGVLTYAKACEGFMEVWKATGNKEFWMFAPSMVTRGMAYWKDSVFKSRDTITNKKIGFDVSDLVIPGGITVHVVIDLATELGANSASGIYKSYGVNLNDVALTRYGTGGKIERGPDIRGVFKTSNTVHDYTGLLIERPESHLEFANIEMVA